MRIMKAKTYLVFQPFAPKTLQSHTLKLDNASLNTSGIGMHPDCDAGVVKPEPTELALSLKGLQPQLIEVRVASDWYKKDMLSANFFFIFEL